MRINLQTPTAGIVEDLPSLPQGCTLVELARRLSVEYQKSLAPGFQSKIGVFLAVEGELYFVHPDGVVANLHMLHPVLIQVLGRDDDLLYPRETELWRRTSDGQRERVGEADPIQAAIQAA